MVLEPIAEHRLAIEPGRVNHPAGRVPPPMPGCRPILANKCRKCEISLNSAGTRRTSRKAEELRRKFRPRAATLRVHVPGLPSRISRLDAGVSRAGCGHLEVIGAIDPGAARKRQAPESKGKIRIQAQRDKSPVSRAAPRRTAVLRISGERQFCYNFAVS